MKRLISFLLFLLWGTSASAFPYVIDTFVNGAEMAGMEVTVYFGNGTSETVTWSATGAESGAAIGSDWSLSQSGDTLNQPGVLPAWTLSNLTGFTITRFTIDAWVAKVFFDVMLESVPDSVGTPGSGQGRPFTDDGTLNIITTWDIYGGSATPQQSAENTPHVTYLNNLYGAPDLFGGLDVVLGSTGLASNSSFRFVIDTDQVSEPPLYGLLALGLAAGFYLRRRVAAA